MVIDTSIVIEHLRAKDKSATTLFKLPEEEDLFISTVTLFELYSGATSPDKEKSVQDICEDFIILPFTADIAVKAGEIYRQLKSKSQSIGVADIFIAATCLSFSQPIVTLNKKHFRLIDDLIILG